MTRSGGPEFGLILCCYCLEIEVIYVGDDIPDYEIMRRTECSCCPADACADIKAIARYISQYEGGKGCGRDIIEQVLRAQGKWLKDSMPSGGRTLYIL